MSFLIIAKHFVHFKFIDPKKEMNYLCTNNNKPEADSCLFNSVVFFKKHLGGPAEAEQLAAI